MKKSMKKRFALLLSTLFAAFALCVSMLAVPVKANADEVLEAATEQMLYFGDVVESTAKVKTDSGETEDRPIIWDNLNANEVNANFSMAEAVGTIQGTDERVSRKFFTLPRGLVYFVNCGALTNQTDAGYNDVYYGLNEAILDNYEAPTSTGKLLNRIPDQVYNSGDGWGYTEYSASYKSSSKHMPVNAGDPMPPAFPYNTIRATDSKDLNYGIEYTLGNLTAGVKYRLYVGTRSHWHARVVTPVINGVAQPNFEISAVAKVMVYDDITPNGSNAIKLAIQGKNTDEGNCAFIAVQTMEAANQMATEAPAAPTYDGTLQIGQTEFTVSNATAGTKVQVSLADAPFSVLFEGWVEEDGDFAVTLPADKLDEVYSLHLAAVNTFGPSEYKTVFITDITDFTVTLSTNEYTADNITVTVTGKSENTISRLEVTHNYVTTTYDGEGFGDLSYEGTFEVEENGIYLVRLFNGIDGNISKEINVTTIDKTDVSLAVSLASNGFTDKTRVALTYEGAAPLASYTVYNEQGEAKISGTGAPSALDLDYGRYVFSVLSESGKVATVSAIVSNKPIYFTLKTESTGDGTRYTFEGANGKSIALVAAYRIEEGVAGRLSGSGNSLTNRRATDVYARVEYTDGTVEFNKIANAPAAAPAPATKKKGCGSAVSAASLVLALGALAAAAVVIGAKRRAKAN